MLPQDPEDDQEKVNQSVFLAELYRLKGVFELCVMYVSLAGIYSGDNLIEEAFMKECDDRNTEVFQLK